MTNETPYQNQAESSVNKTTIFGIDTLKILFAFEYILQGIANPFQGITYHPFFRHFRFHYGIDEASTQDFFSKSYLAWSFKPVMGFFMDAYGKTRTILIFLLLSGAGLYILTPFIDFSALIFFWLMFFLGMLFAATDVAVDRATVLAGDEESRSSGKSKATTVGLNQSICWAAIYGTNIVAGFSGGWIADNIPIGTLLFWLAAVPIVVFLIVLKLPRDKSVCIPLKKSVINFWDGLNTGPVLWIILFYFLFHFQPAMGALWTDYGMKQLHFTQTELGISDGVAYTGYFIGVLLFATLGVKWQEKSGLRKIFKIFIILSILVNLTQYLLVDPLFSSITAYLHRYLSWVDIGTVRLAFYSIYYFFVSILISMIRMSTFSLVGAVIPVAAAGSLFAGFMSVSNLAYSFSYSSGSWLYDHGLEYGIFRFFQNFIFGIPIDPGQKMSINLLIMIGSLAYLLSFAAVHMLPDKKQTNIKGDVTEGMVGPLEYQKLDPLFLNYVNRISLFTGIVLFAIVFFGVGMDPIASVISAFFTVAFIRKCVLDYQYRGQ